MVELEGETDPLQVAMKELKYVFTSLIFLSSVFNQKLCLFTLYYANCQLANPSLLVISNDSCPY